MKDLQFKTNKIIWEKTKDGDYRVKDVLMLKDPSRYGSRVATAIADELLPNKLEYRYISVFDRMLDEYEMDFEELDLDPIADILGEKVDERERDGIRVLYMMMVDSSLPEDLSVEKQIKAYHETCDVSSFPDSELESAYI